MCLNYLHDKKLGWNHNSLLTQQAQFGTNQNRNFLQQKKCVNHLRNTRKESYYAQKCIMLIKKHVQYLSYTLDFVKKISAASDPTKGRPNQGRTQPWADPTKGGPNQGRTQPPLSLNHGPSTFKCVSTAPR